MISDFRFQLKIANYRKSSLKLGLTPVLGQIFNLQFEIFNSRSEISSGRLAQPVFMALRNLFLTDKVDVPRQAQELQDSDAIPVDINLVPFQTVFGGSRKRMMVIVPTFAEGQQGHPPTVGRIISRFETSFAPQVSRRIN